jgi:hypothetical protein
MKPPTLAGAFMAIAGAAHAAAPRPVDCVALARQFPGAAFEIVKAEVMPAAALPAHCRVEGVMDKRIGVDGKAYAIRFAVAMPGQSRPLCAFPKHAQYVSGDEMSAASYHCTE